MTIYTDTKELFEHGLKNQLDILESERIKVTSSIRFLLVYGHFYWAVIICGFLFSFIILSLDGVWDNILFDNIFMYSFFIFIYSLIIATIIAMFLERKEKKEKRIYNFLKKVKQKIYPKILKIIGLQLFYNADLNSNAINQANTVLNELFDYDCDSIKFEDHIFGKYKDSKIDIVDFKIGFSSETIINSEGKEVFKHPCCAGVLFELKIKKHISSKLLVTYSGFATKALTGNNRVILESQDFNEKYKVICDDQIEARYFLTPTVIERLTKFHIENKILCLLIKDNSIYVTLSSKGDYFEINPNKPINVPSQYSNLLSEIKEVLDFIDVLKLNLDVGL